MLTKLLSSDSQQGMVEDKIVFQSTPRQLNKKTVSALSILLSAAENKDTPPPPADSPFSTSSLCSQTDKVRPRSQNLQHQHSHDITTPVDASRTFSIESKASLNFDSDDDVKPVTAEQAQAFAQAFGSFSLSNSIPEGLVAGRNTVPLACSVLESGSYHPADSFADSFSDIPMCSSPAFAQALSFEYSSKTVTPTAAMEAVNTSQTLPVLNATPNAHSTPSKLSCEDLMKLIISFVTTHRSRSMDNIQQAMTANTSMSFVLENSFLMQKDVPADAKLARLQLFAAEEDGTPMDDLPGFSSATDILNLGVTDFVVVDRTTETTLMHVRISGNIDGKHSPFQGNTAATVATGNMGKYRSQPAKEVVESIHRDFYTLPGEDGEEEETIPGSIEGEDSRESFHIEREDSCAADLITCFRTDTDEMKVLQDKASQATKKKTVLEAKSVLEPIGEDSTRTVEPPVLRRQRSHSGNLMICCRRLNSEKWRVAKELKILANGGVVVASSLDEQLSAQSSNASSKTTSPEKKKGKSGSGKMSKSKSSKSIPIAGALSIQVGELNSSIPMQPNTTSAKTNVAANEGLERRHSERPYNEELDEDGSLDAYVRNWQMFGSGSRNSSFFNQSSNNSTPAVSLNPHTSSSFLAPFSPSNSIRKTISNSSTKSNASKKSSDMSYDDFLSRIHVTRKHSMRNIALTDDGKSSIGDGASTFLSVSDLAVSQNNSSLVFPNDNESLLDDLPSPKELKEQDQTAGTSNNNSNKRLAPDSKKKSSSSMSVFTSLLESSRSPSLSPKEPSHRKEIIITGKEFKKKMPKESPSSGHNSSAPNSPQAGSIQDANSCFEAHIPAALTNSAASSGMNSVVNSNKGAVPFRSNTGSGINSRTSTPTRNELLSDNQHNGSNTDGRRSTRGSSRDWTSWTRVFSNVFNRTRGSSISSNTTDNQTAASTTSSVTHAYDDMKGGFLTNASINSEFEAESMVFIEEGVEIDEEFFVISQKGEQSHLGVDKDELRAISKRAHSPAQKLFEAVSEDKS